MEATEKTISRIRIAPGCIVCNLCEDTCPEVFKVNADTSTLRDAAPDHYRTHALKIIQAAQECPVDVIRVSGFNEPE
jgi:ferredoxin